MTYELAKELEEAGFPQNIGVGDSFFGLPISITRMRINDAHPVTVHLGNIEGYDISKDVDCKIPTLSELIAACGEGFGALARNGQFIKYTVLSTQFVAWGREKVYQGGGVTPEEAVARLWLAIKKK